MYRETDYPRRLSFVIGCAILMLGGCATTTPVVSTCETTDWFATGVEDGARGLPQEQISLHKQLCTLEDSAVDVDAYRAGRIEGLDRFCTMANGKHVGLAGAGYAGVCPAGQEYYFLSGYRMGSEMHWLNSAMATHSADTDRLQERLDLLQAEAQRVIVQQPYSVAFSRN